MSIIERKMKILLGLRGFSIIKINDKQALWKINSENSLTIDITFPSELWEAKHKGKIVNNWKTSPEIPANIRGMIQTLEDDYKAACKNAAVGGDLPEGNDEVSPEPLETIRPKSKAKRAEPEKAKSETPSEPIFPPAKREEAPEKNKNSPVKNAAPRELPGLYLPILAPPEMGGSFMRFKQWTENNDVIPAGSGVVIIDEDDFNFRLSIPQARFIFNIRKDYAEVIQ